ncbi:DHA2 family efflux MFS transporter permease subunit [Kocuria sp. LUK]|nr:DHA2 family efflux MFS transporter permease subunit [Kocuria sp. LUK]MCD1145511.1 DHA2 family efflux MFS transporter permease subunit [Kocuria sp. LUK]
MTSSPRTAPVPEEPAAPAPPVTTASSVPSATTEPAAPPHAPDRASRDRLVLGLLLVSTFVVVLNETIMGVALPTLMQALSITALAGQWLTTAFMLTMAVVIPVTGFLLQRLATRPVFLAAMGLFSLGTLVCALAPGFGVLLAGRVVQACGTAIMLPLLMTTVLALVPAERQGRVMGNISVVISVAPAVGPTVSGLILSVLDWRWMFGAVLPIALGALLLGALRIPDVTEPRPAPLDVSSVVLSALGFGGLVHGLSTLGEGGSAAVPAWLPLAVGAAALAGFVRRQLRLQRADRALLDLRTFAAPTFRAATAVLGVSVTALFGTLLVLPIYLQDVRGLDPLATGLFLLPGGIVMGALAPVVGRAYDRWGPTRLLVPGTAVVSLALWCLALASPATPVAAVLAVHVLLSTGLSLVFTPLFTAGLGSLPPHLHAHGSAVVGTVQQVAGAAGAALFVAVLTLGAEAAPAAAGEAGAVAAGVRLAFLCGAVLSLLAVAGAVRVRRPAGAQAPSVPAP